MEEGAGRKVGSRFFRRTPQKQASAVRCPNLDGARPCKRVWQIRFVVSPCGGFESDATKTPAAESATGGILKAESPLDPSAPTRVLPVPSRLFRVVVVRLSPVTRRRKSQTFSFSRMSGAALARAMSWRENAETATAGLLTRSVRDAFPTLESVARECRGHPLRPAEQEHTAAGTVRDSHPIPI